uniref:NADH dehydrogenase subunit 6 n=1 Tax=Pagurus maculosus TaxID=1929469 RepID=A0A2Z5UY20_9EUCA|nr:NADH dehydrogenase subunit 6 [Pagurus maculosus]
MFLGGMLVLFIYVASLASNEQFSIDLTFFLISLSIISFIFLMLLMLDPVILSNKMTMLYSSLMNEYKFSSNSLFNSPIYNTPSAFFTFFIISYLLLALLVVVKIMNSSSSPLRLMTYENTSA